MVLDADGTTTGVINDQFGNGVATVSGGSVTWNATRVGAYGPLPGIQPLTLGDVTQLAAATAWRGHRIDPTGFYWLGARYYEPTSGRFLSADPMGHAASPPLYDYCLGDPVNFVDPMGLVRWGQFSKGVASIAGGVIGTVILGTAEIGSGGLATGGVILLSTSVAGAYSYGIGNVVAAFSDDEVRAKRMEGSPSTLPQLVARGIGGEPAQNTVGIVEAAVGLNTSKGALEVTKATIEVLDAEMGLVNSLEGDSDAKSTKNKGCK